jgi:hypothetical protein
MYICVRNVSSVPIGWHRNTQNIHTCASAIVAEEAEEIDVEHLLRDIKDTTTTMLATHVSKQLSSHHGLSAHLLRFDVQRYLVNVSRTMPMNTRPSTSSRTHSTYCRTWPILDG